MGADTRESPRKWWLAGLLSLIQPGLGQLYNGQVYKALLIFILPFLFVVPAKIVLLDHTSIGLMAFGLGAIVSYYFIVISDAVIVAKRQGAAYSLKKFNRVYVYILVLAVGACLSYFIKSAYVQAFKFPSGSMRPTLLIGDYVLVDKRPSALKELRGGLVVFEYPEDPTKDFLKRIVALEGDKVEIRDKKLFINDKLQDEPYVIYTDDFIIPARIQPRDNFGPITVPTDSVFAMGDNRDHSFDSRFWGTVSKSKLKGKVKTIYWSWDGEESRVRWERIGMKVH